MTIEGRIVNGTEGGGSVEGVRVVLVEKAPAAQETSSTAADADGRFRFDDVVYDPQTLYGLTVQRLGVVYGGPLDLSSGPPPLVEITVYDAASNEANIAVGSSSLLIAGVDPGTRTVSVLEIVTLRNDGDVAYVPGPDPMSLLRFSLPTGATELAVDTSLLAADFVQVDRGFALTVGVPPGTHEIMFGYRFPYSGSETSFVKTFRYGADEVRVLAPEGVAELSVDGLGASGTAAIGERSYTVYEGSAPRGERVSVSLGALPQPSVGQRVANAFDGVRLEYVSPAGLGALMVGVVIFVLWRRPSRA